MCIKLVLCLALPVVLRALIFESLPSISQFRPSDIRHDSLSCRAYSAGFALAPNSAGDGGIPAPFLIPAPRVYNVTAISYLYMQDGTPGVDFVQGNAGQSRSQAPYGAPAEGGAPLEADSAFCSGGGGFGWGGGASGGYIMGKNGCTGAGGAGGGWFYNASHSIFLSNPPASGYGYGYQNNSGVVSALAVYTQAVPCLRSRLR